MIQVETAPLQTVNKGGFEVADLELRFGPNSEEGTTLDDPTAVTIK